MGDVPPPPPDQPLPEWLTWSLVTNADGSEEYTIATLPLTYYGPSIPLGTDGPFTDGGLTSPADSPTEEAPADPAPTEDLPALTPTLEPQPTTVFITVTPNPTTVFITTTLPPITVTVTQPPSSGSSLTPGTVNPSSSSLSNIGSNTPTFSPSISLTSGSALPAPGISSTSGSVPRSSTSGSVSSGSTISSSSTLTPSVSSVSSSSRSVSSVSGIPSTSGSASSVPSSSRSMSSVSDISSTSMSVPSTSGTGIGSLPTGSSTNEETQQPGSNTPPSSTSPSGSSPAQDSSLPSVTGTARTYLGLPPDAFLGVVLAIVLSVILLLCCILCWIRHRRRRRRRQQAALLPPTAEQGSRLLAGDRDPTREDLAYPYVTQQREYRRSQIAMMRARGELDDDWEDRLHSPSMRTASVRLPEDEVGTAYGIRERAFAAAGVYGYTPVPRDSPSIGTGTGSVGDSTQVPTIRPANAAVGIDARSSPAPRKDTRSTEATASSALHLYAAGGRSRGNSNNAPDEFFYNNTSEGEAPSPVASSADLHFLQRYSSQGAGGAAAIAASRAARRHAPSTGTGSGSGSPGSNSGPSTGVPEVPRTRNLEELPRAAIAYPESPVSDDQESSRLMPEGERGEPPMMVLSDTAPDRSSHSTRESGLSRWIHGSDRSTRGSQQQAPILQRVLQRVMGNRLSTQPSFSIVPTSEAQTQHNLPPPAAREPWRMSLDFDFGNGLLFPRPPVHTGYSSGANTARPLPGSAHGSGVDVNSLSQMEQGGENTNRALGAPIMVNRDAMPQMRERSGTAASAPLLGSGLRPPPPSAFPPERRSSGVSSGRSTVYYDARSTTSTPMDSLNGNRDQAGSPLSRYDSPPPQPITALRNAQSAQSFQTADSAPFLPPGLFVTADDEHGSEAIDILDTPPPMSMRDIRQARSLNTIFSVGTAETYDTANPPLSIGRAFLRDEQTRFPPPGLDPAPRISRSVPSDVAPSEAADADLGAATMGSTGRASGNWQRDHEVTQVDEDMLEEDPPMAANQWRVLSAYPYDDNGSLRGSFRAGTPRSTTADQPNWRLTLGQPVTIIGRDEDSPRHSELGDLLSTQQEWPTAVGYDGSQGSRGSSNRTNASHSRDIHSLRASEGALPGGSNGSKGSTQTGSSHRPVSEHGHIRYSGKSSSGMGEALLSAFGPGPGRQARGTGGGGGTVDSMGEASDDIISPSPRKRAFWWGDRARDSPEPSRPRTPPSAPAGSSATPGIRLVGSSNEAGTSEQGPSSAPVLPTRGWPSQGVPLDVTVADGRRPSQSHSFVHRESPLRSYAGLHSHSPGPSLSHAREISRPGTSTSHSHSHHTHGTHGAETTMGTMTEATTEDDHEQEPMPDMPLSDVEHILHSNSPKVGGDQRMIEEEHGRGRIIEDGGGGGGGAPPSPGRWMPRWQQQF